MKCFPICLVTLCLLLAAPHWMMAQRGRQGPDCPELGVIVDPEHPLTGFPPVAYIRGPKPVYPTALRGRNVEGRVVLRFVVRCTGRADSTTVAVIQATDAAFIRPAINVVLRSEYRPAVVRGQKVAVPLEQVVRFKPKSPT